MLDRGEAFVASREGFALDTPIATDAWQNPLVALPRNGRETIRFRGFGGAAVRVRELGAEGEGTLAARSVAYPRAGGTSFWTASSGGVEEWLSLEASAVRPGEAVATWEVEGAEIRQHGEGVEIIDAGGVVRLSVTAPKAYAAGGREVAARLVGSGARVELRVDAAGEALLVDPLWVPAGSMSEARYAHTATRLSSGKVLVAGGYSEAVLASAESYDPVTNSWSPAGSMVETRTGHTATLLASGVLLVAGGVDASGAHLASSELYDPATNTWAPTGAMSQARATTSALLKSGKVLVAGGEGNNGTLLASAEIYDPATSTWSSAGAMSEARLAPSVTLLASGKVLVSGGQNSAAGNLASAEIYDPATNAWSPAGSMSDGRAGHTSTLLGSGKVLVAGGIGNGNMGSTILASAELYDPAMDTWAPAEAMTDSRESFTATLLGNGMVLVAGGNYLGPAASAELYDPATNTWSLGGGMSESREIHTATLLGSGQVLVAGGAGQSGTLASAELYSPAPLGSVCGLRADCQSGFCVDGVCCGAECAPHGASSASSGGEGGSGGGGGAVSGGSDSSGCGCEVGAGAGSTGGALWIGLGLLLSRRRRRSR